MSWKNFKYGGLIYELDHLSPVTFTYERAATEEKPAIIYNVDILFSMHCFTHKMPSTPFDPELKYSDARETRVFDFKRYELSKRLPEIVRTLAERRCLHTGHRNFVTVDLVDKAGVVESYHVFFEPSKAEKKGRVNLYIQSAYVPDQRVPKTGKPMRFLFILHNTLNRIPIKS